MVAVGINDPACGLAAVAPAPPELAGFSSSGFLLVAYTTVVMVVVQSLGLGGLFPVSVLGQRGEKKAS